MGLLDLADFAELARSPGAGDGLKQAFCETQAAKICELALCWPVQRFLPVLARPDVHRPGNQQESFGEVLNAIEIGLDGAVSLVWT